MKRILFVIAAFVFVSTFAASNANPVNDKPASGTQGMVSSGHPLPTQAGLDVLAAGGNAFDAAVAVAATLNVVEPMMPGMGGYGVTLIYDAAKHETRFLDSSGRIPASLNTDVFRAPTPNYLHNREGTKTVTGPGPVNECEAVSTGYGKLASEGRGNFYFGSLANEFTCI